MCDQVPPQILGERSGGQLQGARGPPYGHRKKTLLSKVAKKGM